jgi:hypothetical protein
MESINVDDIVQDIGQFIAQHDYDIVFLQVSLTACHPCY